MNHAWKISVFRTRDRVDCWCGSWGSSRHAETWLCEASAFRAKGGKRNVRALARDREDGVETTLKDKASGELARTLSQARHALLKPLKDYRDSLEELTHFLQRCAR
jgi:hypothetical protein